MLERCPFSEDQSKASRSNCESMFNVNSMGKCGSATHFPNIRSKASRSDCESMFEGEFGG